MAESVAALGHQVPNFSYRLIRTAFSCSYFFGLLTLILKLMLQYFGHLMRRANSLEKTLMLGKIEDRRRRG